MKKDAGYFYADDEMISKDQIFSLNSAKVYQFLEEGYIGTKVKLVRKNRKLKKLIMKTDNDDLDTRFLFIGKGYVENNYFYF